jgi:hypothetical protein
MPKRAPPAAPPGKLLAATAQTPHLSTTTLRKTSRSATKEGDSKKNTNYLWLFITRMPLLRRQD